MNGAQDARPLVGKPRIRWMLPRQGGELVLASSGSLVLGPASWSSAIGHASEPRTRVIDAATGAIRFDMGGVAPLLVEDGLVVVGYKSRLLAYELATGREVWDHGAGLEPFARVARSETALFVRTLSKVLAFERPEPSGPPGKKRFTIKLAKPRRKFDDFVRVPEVVPCGEELLVLAFDKKTPELVGHGSSGEELFVVEDARLPLRREGGLVASNGYGDATIFIDEQGKEVRRLENSNPRLVVGDRVLVRLHPEKSRERPLAIVDARGNVAPTRAAGDALLVAASDTVYACGLRIEALGLDGRERWSMDSKELLADPRADWGPAPRLGEREVPPFVSGVALDGALVLLTSAGDVLCLEAA